MKKKVIVVMPADMVGGDLKGAWCHESNTAVIFSI